MTMTVDDLRYPVGQFTAVRATEEVRDAAVQDLIALPQRMRDAVAGLSDAQLDTPYRPGGWTVRQVVHHVPDSHLNAYIRMKLALTEPMPTIKPYDEKAWATLADTRLPVAVSLQLLESVHVRWAAIIRSLTPADLSRTFHHPEFPDGPLTLDYMLQSYAWHSRHHVAHITALRQRQGW
jgi:hypothetical protein